MARNQIILFLLILFLAIGLRLVNLDRGYNSDEGWLIETASLPLSSIVPFLTSGVESRSVYPPLSPFLLHLWMKIGTAEIWVRCYFVLFGIALCLVIYKMGVLFCDRRFGLAAFFISAVSPLLIWSSQFVRSYIDSAFWILLSTYFLLKILKAGYSLARASFYVVFSVSALYCSYFNALFLIAHNIFVLLFCVKDIKFIKRWMALQFFVLLFFVPGLSVFLKQIKFATSIDSQWSQRGFQLFGINIGYHARAIAASFGMDPEFLSAGPVKKQLGTVKLIVLSAGCFFVAIWIFIRAVFSLKKLCSDKKLTWFFPVIFLIALLGYDALVEFKDFPMHARYFVPQHALFIFIITAFILGFKSYKTTIAALLVVSSIFVLRVVQATSPVFDTKAAYAYLADNIADGDCLLMVRDTNRHIKGKFNNIAVINSYLAHGYKHEGKDADCYKPLNNEALGFLNFVKRKFRDIWFYRLYGNDEILGANNLMLEWFRNNGYKSVSTKKLKRIDIIHYRREGQ